MFVFRQNSYLLLKRFLSNYPNRVVRIGCASGFWGDTNTSTPQLLNNGEIDYLVMDYLSEITMSLLAAMQQRNPNLGYCSDFVTHNLSPYLKLIKNNNIKVISNAGGINPRSCAEVIQAELDKNKLDLTIATITGDNMKLQFWKKEYAKAYRNEIFNLPENSTSLNAYLGSLPISKALDLGADIVITGRCVDSALVLGPLIHEFKWKLDDWDKLAMGSLAGHLIECGAQSTGGIFTDWEKVKDWENIGFPVAECSQNGDFNISKPPKTGGLVSKATVSEQLVYEIGDPKHYYLPDVECDFSKVKLTETVDSKGEPAVAVTGAAGSSPTGFFKVSGTTLDGYRSTAIALVGGPKSFEKCLKTGNAILSRVRSIFKKFSFEDFSKTNMQVVGSGDIYGPNSVNPNIKDAALWLAVQHPNKRALELFSREIAGAGTGMAPGFMSLVGGRPKISPVLKLFSFLYPASELPIQIHIQGKDPIVLNSELPLYRQEIKSTMTAQTESGKINEGNFSYRIEDLAYTRSGDKGNSANVGVVARHKSYYPYLCAHLTADVVGEYFSHLYSCKQNVSELVKRYELPGISALNFVLDDCLGGGGVSSLRTDPQGKALGQMLLDFKLSGLPSLQVMSEND